METTTQTSPGSYSAPGRVHYTEQKISLRICTGGAKGVACPITHIEFERGQIVYILKIEKEKALEGNTVGCISAEGMNKLKQMCGPDEQFRDPLRRTGDCLLTLSNDFEAFVIRDDSDSEGEEKDEKRRKKTH